MITSKPLAIALIALTPTLAVAQSVDTTLQLELATEHGAFDSRSVLYDCSDGEPFYVDYVNAAPNFLALVPIADEPQRLVFVSVLTGSGARYVAGQWMWWTEGVDASLYDTTLGDDAAAVLTCTEFIQTP